ncbi:hypothetical protein BS47DRAFT_1342404 [Hydnum rufescens UP504]|uniref:Uncharacterized protein n=1 Tax=Hydnum rufescens UP504 TaxID=1448309 RepID=A0A9P6B101_9AGAM|nr:hypothetical protein BS47DRAFT_1342404 [Hydnum rufescens UP504]
MTIRRETRSPSHWTLCPVPKNQVPGRKDEYAATLEPLHTKIGVPWAPGCPLPLQTFTPCGQCL